jgi:hypothetical protein
VLTPGSCAMGIHEPCQVRKEAALSGSFHVPQGGLGRANCLSSAYGCEVDGRCTAVYNVKTTHFEYEMSFFVFSLINRKKISYND